MHATPATAGDAGPAPTITRVVRALGAGPARSVAMDTAFIAASGPRVYVSTARSM
jgi:hypothetical protein